jgi:general secretion pathway protein G
MIKAYDNERGLSLIELVITLIILSILSLMILPSAQMTSKRVKEIELRRQLRVVRTAIDEYKKAYDKAVTDSNMITSINKSSGYPESLQQLVEGKDFGGISGTKKKFLRRIPVDPFNPKLKDGVPEWGLRSYSDKPDSTIWGGEDVFDIYSLSEETAIDGTKYKDW